MPPVSSWLFWPRANGNNQLRRQNFRPRAFPNLSGPLSTTFVMRAAFRSGSVVHQHGSWIGCGSGVHHSVAENSLLAPFSHPLGKFAACLRLRVNGACSPARGVFCCCGACRRRMDNVGFRTLGGDAARDPGPGPGPHERHGDHDLAGGDGAWRNDLGSAAAMAGASSTLLGAAMLFLT